jgi:hypothetical protein
MIFAKTDGHVSYEISIESIYVLPFLTPYTPIDDRGANLFDNMLSFATKCPANLWCCCER